MKKKKKKKLNKRKFISRIFFLVLLIVLIVFIFKSFGKKKDNEIVSNIFVNNINITENLIDKPYINKDNVLYLSIADIKKIFDKNIFYEEETKKIITTSGTKVAAIDVDNNIAEINSASNFLSAGVLNLNANFYIPISELTSVYNIEAFTTENTAILSSIYEEFITVKSKSKVSLKEKTSVFSKTIEKLEEGKEVIFVSDTDKNGWTKVLTYEGNMGYIKNKKLTNKEQKRVKMEDSDFVGSASDISKSVEVNSSKLNFDNLNNFNNRKKLVEAIITEAVSKEKFTININLQDVNMETRYLERFIIELIPRIKEIGGSVVLTNNSILGQDFLSENRL